MTSEHKVSANKQDQEKAEAGMQAPAGGAAALPSAWINAHRQHESFWGRLALARQSLLICDYDGTLAPFKADKMLAVPFVGVVERLERIAATPGAGLALVSGRPVGELLTLLPLAARLEVFGSHGREYRSAEGAYALEETPAAVRVALDAAATELEAAGWGIFLERKSGSLAVHWRNLSPARQGSLAQAAGEVFGRHTEGEALAVLPFESGMELRANDQTKAHAVEKLVAGISGGDGEAPVVAYLGDDVTDEDAFRALGSRGLSMLVREEPRVSLANYWLRPPAQLLGFLDDWLRAASRSI